MKRITAILASAPLALAVPNGGVSPTGSGEGELLAAAVLALAAIALARRPSH